MEDHRCGPRLWAMDEKHADPPDPPHTPLNRLGRGGVDPGTAVYQLLPFVRQTARDPKRVEAVIKELPVLPGQNTATLTLSDGKQIVLDSVKDGELAIQGKTQVVKSAPHGIIYQEMGATDARRVAYNILATPRSGQYQLTLQDGSKVWLNNASSLRYPTDFNGWQRRVELTGEAYFEIAANARQPFVVEVAGSEVKVLGMPAQDIVSWKDRFFYFGRASFATVTRQLARWYNVEVVYNGKPPEIEFAGKIERDLPLADLLRFLEGKEVHFRLEGRKQIVLP
jgi:transmembrane sensor